MDSARPGKSAELWPRLGADASWAQCIPLTLDIPASVFTEIPTAEIVGVAQAAPVLEFAAPLLVPIIVEPGDESPTRSLLQRQKADL